MLETWLSKERLLSNCTPRFLTDDEESTEQPSYVRQCSRLLFVWVLGPIINKKNHFFSEFSCKKLLIIHFLYQLYIPEVSQFGVFHRTAKKYRAEYHKHNPMFPEDISQG